MVNEADAAVLRRLLAEAEKKRDDFNARSSSAEPTARMATRAVEVDPEESLVALVPKCDPSSSSIDEALQAIEADPSLPYVTRKRFFEKVRETCLYAKRLGHLFALPMRMKSASFLLTLAAS